MKDQSRTSDTQRSIFRNLSPLDHRYYLANKELFEKLADFISEDSSIKYLLAAEKALLKTHLTLLNRLSPELDKTIEDSAASVDPAEVYQEEEKTQHNIRALVNVFQRHLPEELRHFVHMGATSVDILDTAASMRYRDVVQQVVLPELIVLEEHLTRLANQEAETPQVGRTHGQHAVPITLGFALAEYVSRLGKSIEQIYQLSTDLRGKLAGAVGSYNATSLMSDDPAKMEELYLSYLNLKPSDHSTQMVEPEHLLRLLLEINVSFGVIANLADDLRHLQRSEISEVREFFSKDQVGSSTMPQKRNPWNSEHVKSLWKAFAPRVMTFYMDQISEHQRDLSNSASARFVTDYLAGFVAAVARMNKILKSLYVDTDRLRANLAAGGEFVLAEAAYILLAADGEAEAHEIVRKSTLQSEETGKRLVEILKSQPEVWQSIGRSMKKTIKIDPEEFFSNPGLYRGLAAAKAKNLASDFSGRMNALKEALCL